MTSLFFVMLVLFVLVIVLLHNKIKEIEGERNATRAQVDKIREIEKTIEKIDTNYFQFDANFKRHTLREIHVSFPAGIANIFDPLISQDVRDKLVEAGWSIKQFVQDAVNSIPEVRYLLIVEGQASRDRFRYNYELSYQRALALVRFWEENNISFNDEYCEIIISGSGDGRIFRNPNRFLFREPDERANQRFVIHIIPKPGVIESNKTVNETQ